MPRLDIVLSNDGHHLAMFRAVADKLLESAEAPDLRFVSLCELRGLRTPDSLRQTGSEVMPLLPFRLRRGGSGGLPRTDRVDGRRREWLRKGVWSLILKTRVDAWLESEPDLVVVPNDAAYPYDLLCQMLNRRSIPFVLVQEGIRFPMPNAEGDRYGQGGAAAVAAWGENSATFFAGQGVPEEKIVVTGSPRYDSIAATDWTREAHSLRRAASLDARTLLILTNPIDAQGFCSSEEKVNLVVEFLRRIEPLLTELDLTVVVKIHGGESFQDYELALRTLRSSDRIRLMQREPLYPLLVIADAAIVLASTVGLEALLFERPLGVLEIPGHGFVFDYVESGAAVGLSWRDDLVAQTRILLEQDPTRTRNAARYVHENLAYVGTSSQRVSDLLVEQLGAVCA